MEAARKLPRKTAAEKEIRSNAIKNIRTKKESAALIRKYGSDNIKAPDEAVREEITNREAHSFIESIKIKRELSAWLKAESVYKRVIKPYTDAQNLITQADNYMHYEELENKFSNLKTI